MSVLDERKDNLNIGSLHRNSFLHDNVHLLSNHSTFQLQKPPSSTVTGSQTNIGLQATSLQSVNNIPDDCAQQTCLNYFDRNIFTIPTHTVANTLPSIRNEFPLVFNQNTSTFKDGCSYNTRNNLTNGGEFPQPNDNSKFFNPTEVTSSAVSSAFARQNSFVDSNPFIDSKINVQQYCPISCERVEMNNFSPLAASDDRRNGYGDASRIFQRPTIHVHPNQLTDERRDSMMQPNRGVDLLISNLDYNISAKEWRRLLFSQLQSATKHVHSVVIQAQADGSNCAVVRVGSIEDARLAISLLHRKKIGYKRIQLNILNPGSSFNIRNIKGDVISLLRSVAGGALPIGKFVELFEKRFSRTISVSDLYRMRDVVEIREQLGSHGGKMVLLSPRATRFDLLEQASVPTESIVCRRHCAEGSPDYVKAVESTTIPLVLISLSTFRQQVTTILRDHNGSLPLLSFPACYKAEYGELPTTPQSASYCPTEVPVETGQVDCSELGNKSISTEPAIGVEADTDAHPPCISTNSGEYVSAVPLEHLLTCVPNVRVCTESNGVRMVLLEPDQPFEMNGLPSHPTNAMDNIFSKYQGLDLNPIALAHGSSASLNTGVNPSSGVLQDQLHQFSREVVDLLKHQPGCQLLLSKFIPSYHHHFGKQCRVADYGYSKLHELIDALPNVVHVMGSGNTRLLTLSHRVQVRRFTNELIKVLKSQSTKSCKITDYPSLYKRIYRKDFRIADYGVCFLNDILAEIADNNIELSPQSGGPDRIVSLPKRVQTADERERTELFAIEVADLLRQSPRCRLPFNKFIPSYHHHFSRQCRVADYGFTKLIDLLEAVPNVVRVIEELGEKYVVLVRSRHLRIVAEQLLSMLESAPEKRIRLDELLKAYLKVQGYPLCVEDFQLDSIKDLLAKLPRIVRIETIPAAAEPSDKPTQVLTNQEEIIVPEETTTTKPVAESSPATEDKSLDGDTDAGQQAVEYVCLADRMSIKHLAHKVLLILLEAPSAVLSTTVFSERFRSNYKEEPDLVLMQKELGEIVEFREKPALKNEEFISPAVENQDDATCMETPNVMVDPCSTGAMVTGNDVDATDKVSVGKFIALQPLIVFARELRDLLRQNQGKLLLVQLCAAYQRRFGVPLRPERYNHHSLATLIQSVDFVAVTRGRGVRCTLVLCQDFLGKLSYRVAFDTKPVLDPESDNDSKVDRTAFASTIEPHGTTKSMSLPTNLRSLAESNQKCGWSPHNANIDPGIASALPSTRSVNKPVSTASPYNYYPVQSSQAIPPFSTGQMLPPNYGYYQSVVDYGPSNFQYPDGPLAQTTAPYTSFVCPPQNAGYGSLTMLPTSTNSQLPNSLYGETVNPPPIHYSGPVYPPQSMYSAVPLSLNYAQPVPPLAHQCTSQVISTASFDQSAPIASYSCNLSAAPDKWPPLSSNYPINAPGANEQQLDDFVERLANNGIRYDFATDGVPDSMKPEAVGCMEQALYSHPDRQLYYVPVTPRSTDVANSSQYSTTLLPNFSTSQTNGIPYYSNSFLTNFPPANQFGQFNGKQDVPHSYFNGVGNTMKGDQSECNADSSSTRFLNKCSNEQSNASYLNAPNHMDEKPRFQQNLTFGNTYSTPYSALPFTARSVAQPTGMNFSGSCTTHYLPVKSQHRSSDAADSQNAMIKTSSPKQPAFITSPGATNSREESTGSFSLDGLLAELHLEERELQQNQINAVAMNGNLDHSTPLTQNHFAYF